MNPDLWQRPLWAFLSWLPVPLGAVALLLPAWPPFARRFARPWTSVLFFVLTRLAFAGLVFGLLRHQSLDLLAFHEPQGRAALAGQIPYRDFVSLYAPGLPYVLGLGVLLSSTWGPLALFVLADLGAFTALARLAGHARPGVTSPAWLYLAFPPVWYFEVRYAQDETLAALCLSLAMLALSRGRSLLGGLALAGGQLVTKPLFGVGALPLVLAPGAPRAARLGYALPVLLVYLGMTLAGIPWQRDLALEASAFGIGPVLWRLPAFWWGFSLGRFAWAPEILLIAIGFARLWRRRAGGVDFAAWLWGCHNLAAPKLMPMFVVMVAPVLAAWVGRAPGRGRLAWWALYGLALGTAWYADSGPLQGLLGPVGVGLGAVVMLAPPALAAWLLAAVWREPPAPAAA